MIQPKRRHTGSSKNEASQWRPGFTSEAYIKTVNLIGSFDIKYVKTAQTFADRTLCEYNQSNMDLTVLIKKAAVEPTPTSVFMLGDLFKKALYPSTTSSNQPENLMHELKVILAFIVIYT